MLKKCSCGSSNVTVVSYGDKFQIGCKDCLKSTELKDTEEKAKQDWNKGN